MWACIPIEAIEVIIKQLKYREWRCRISRINAPKKRSKPSAIQWTLIGSHLPKVILEKRADRANCSTGILVIPVVKTS